MPGSAVVPNRVLVAYICLPDRGVLNKPVLVTGLAPPDTSCPAGFVLGKWRWHAATRQADAPACISPVSRTLAGPHAD